VSRGLVVSATGTPPIDRSAGPEDVIAVTGSLDPAGAARTMSGGRPTGSPIGSGTVMSMSASNPPSAPATAPTATNERSSVVRSVDRALSIMEILARDGWSSVTDIARELEVHKSTVFRLVATLQRRGIVEQHPSTQKYRLGFAIARLASGVRGNPDLIDVARPSLERLSEELDETVDLAVMEDGEVTNIDQANLSSSIVAVDWIGHRSPMHVAASGKVYLAFGDQAETEAFLARPLEAVTPKTITDPDLLREDLRMVRQRGFSITRGELEEGLNAVAAPIHASDGSVVAVIVVSGPEYRMNKDRLHAAGTAVCEAAATVSRQLGWVTGGGAVPVTATPRDRA
jgi:IclR family transcriptional regulator, acetate operon repressor